jgi:hypothetical protein
VATQRERLARRRFRLHMKNRFREFFADKVDVAHTAQEEPKNAS